MDRNNQTPVVPPLDFPESSETASEMHSQRYAYLESHESSFSGFFKKMSSALGLPSGFFRSRAEVRTWGEENLADPSVQPRSETALPYLGTSLPGYPKSACTYLNPTFGSSKAAPEFVSLFTMLEGHDKLKGPKLVPFFRCEVKYPTLPLDKFATPTYDYRDLLGYRMDYHPYVNAEMNPQDPARMYVCANWMVGYPYGVPAVEENERAARASASAMGFR